jgi:hypothetical protein
MTQMEAAQILQSYKTSLILANHAHWIEDHELAVPCS